MIKKFINLHRNLHISHLTLLTTIIIMLCGLSSIAYGMKSTDNPMQEIEPEKPLFIQIPVKNYCKKIIEALEDDDKLNEINNPFDLDTQAPYIQALKQEFLGFYAKIPYTGKVDKMKDNAPKFYRALSCCLCSCLTGQAPDQPSFFFDADQPDIVAIGLRGTNKSYVLQFSCQITKEQRSKDVKQRDPIYTYAATDAPGNKPTEVIAITFFINVKTGQAFLKITMIENTGTKRVTVQSFELNTQKNVFYEPLIDNLSYFDKKDTLTKSLNTFYNMIPKSFRIAAEKFYQSMLFSVITFFRSSFATVEAPTSRGRADIIMYSAQANKCNSVIEFKRNKGTKTAIKQIYNRNYPDYLNDDTKDIAIIAINIDDQEETIVVDAEPEKYEKSINQGSPVKQSTQSFQQKQQNIATSKEPRKVAERFLLIIDASDDADYDDEGDEDYDESL